MALSAQRGQTGANRGDELGMGDGAEPQERAVVVADETGDAATAIEHYRAFLRFGAITHPELIAAVRARLTTLGG